MTAFATTIESTVQQRTEAALENLVLNCIEQQKLARKTERIYDRINSLQWVKEWCQITVGCSRRSGFTTAMVNVGTYYFKRPLFVFLNRGRVSSFKSEFKDDIFLTTQDRIINDTIGHSCDAIFVDCFDLKDPLDNIYEVAESMSQKNNPFVLALIQPF